MALNRARQRKRELNTVREALRRALAHEGAFSLVDIGTRIDADYLPDQVPKPVARVVSALVGLGHLVRRRGGYVVTPGGVEVVRQLIRPARAGDLERLPHPPHVPRPFRVLGVPYPCTADDVRHRWRQLARRHHPDRGGDAATFLTMKVAYEEATQLCNSYSRPRPTTENGPERPTKHLYSRHV